MSESDVEYFRKRAAAERQLSADARDPTAAMIHSRLAARYEHLVAAGSTIEAPTLYVVTAQARPGAAPSR